MKKGLTIRSLMLIAGMLAFVTTFLFQTPATTYSKEKASTETKSDSSDKSTPAIVQAPVIAIPGTAIQLGDSVLPVLSVIALPESVKHVPATIAVEVTGYFSVLFRTLIAPNAP
jgi:hypothetical protein